jgi:hypothetical protein
MTIKEKLQKAYKELIEGQSSFQVDLELLIKILECFEKITEPSYEFFDIWKRWVQKLLEREKLTFEQFGTLYYLQVHHSFSNGVLDDLLPWKGVAASYSGPFIDGLNDFFSSYEKELLLFLNKHFPEYTWSIEVAPWEQDPFPWYKKEHKLVFCYELNAYIFIAKPQFFIRTNVRRKIISTLEVAFTLRFLEEDGKDIVFLFSQFWDQVQDEKTRKATIQKILGLE